MYIHRCPRWIFLLNVLFPIVTFTNSPRCTIDSFVLQLYNRLRHSSGASNALSSSSLFLQVCHLRNTSFMYLTFYIVFIIVWLLACILEMKPSLERTRILLRWSSLLPIGWLIGLLWWFLFSRWVFIEIDFISYSSWCWQSSVVLLVSAISLPLVSGILKMNPSSNSAKHC